MPVNGWMGLAYDLKQVADPEQVAPLRRAAAEARHAAADRRRAGDPGELHRAALEAQLDFLRHAVEMADAALARRIGRTLCAGDFAELDGFLAVLRDARSSDQELLDAAAALSLRVTPSPE